MDPIEQTLVATQNLLCALEQVAFYSTKKTRFSGQFIAERSTFHEQIGIPTLEAQRDYRYALTADSVSSEESYQRCNISQVGCARINETGRFV